MAEPSEKSSNPSHLPDPRLNPLLNPTLGQNLGRWAQVYFTSPPEKRESAVVELLRELEGDPPAARNTAREKPAPAALPPVKVSEPPQELVNCPSCREENPAGQAFCGICGTALRSTIEPSPVPSAVPATAAVAPISAEDGLQWLRERVPVRVGDEGPGSGNTWKLVAAGLAIALAVFAYLVWTPRPAAVPSQAPLVSTPASVAAPQAAPTIAPVHPAPTASAPRVQPVPHSPAVETTVARGEDTHQTPLQARLASPPGNASDGDSAGAHPQTEPASAGPGARELKEAQRILAAEGQSRDTTEAAKWLWKAVGKQNPSATLLLADLYLRGDGVPRSCEQARVLLLAALRKGASDAAGKLHELETNGCP
ncbi:MAG: hypothetical protein LAO03_13120 [Acidobacteriia bacterium]|nr:hypothetical protein [Terriglobia bacterium]